MLLNIPTRVDRSILVLDQQPRFFVLASFAARAARPDLDQHKTASQLFPVQRELQVAAFQLLQSRQVAFYLEGPAVPDHHRARAVLPLRDHPFEAGIVQRVVFGLHRQPLVSRIKRRSLGDSPGLQHTLDLQAEIVVQAPGIMLLHDKSVPSFRRFVQHLAGRFWRLTEPPLLVVLLKRLHQQATQKAPASKCAFGRSNP